MATDQAVEFAGFLAQLEERASNAGMDLPTVRDAFESIHSGTTEPEDVTYVEVNAAGVEALWCIPADADPDAVVLYSPMGGGVFDSTHSDRKAAAHIAKAAGARVLVLNCRRAPEHTFPAQINDVEAGYHWLLEQGYRAENVASVGSSLGGNLAVSLVLRLRDKGLALPSAVLAISPWCDLALAGESFDRNRDTDTLLSRPMLELIRSCWLDGTGVDWIDPRVNLLRADLHDLPPIAVFYGEHELLASEAFDFALRAKVAGNDTFLRPIVAGQHSFILGAGRAPEVDEAITTMGNWLRRSLQVGDANRAL